MAWLYAILLVGAALLASDFGTDIDNILTRGASTWTNEEAKQIEGLMKAYGRDKVQKVMIEIRGGEKPSQIINNQ